MVIRSLAASRAVVAAEVRARLSSSVENGADGLQSERSFRQPGERGECSKARLLIR